MNKLKIAVLDNGADEKILALCGLPDIIQQNKGNISDEEDLFLHGTNCAMIIGLNCADAELYSYKLLDNTGKGNVDDLKSAFDWCLMNNIRLVNLSFGNHIDITEFAPDQSVLTTAGTGLISFIRHLITNDTQLGNDLITVTLSYNGNKVVMNESGSSSDNPSTVSVQMLTFFRQITGISSGDIKQSDLFGMIIDMAVNLDNVIVNYKIAIKSA